MEGGKDAASPRYIFTYLCPISRSIFPKEDDDILNYLTDDGQQVEPEFYIPVLPMVLINGSYGVGTGFSSNIPTYNPRAIVDNLKLLLNKGKPIDMIPWFNGFTGKIKKTGPYTYTVWGRLERINDTTIRITELPIKFWTSKHKAILQDMLDEKEIKELREHHTDETVSFTIVMTEEQMKKAEENGLYKTFKLITTIATSNMVLFDANGKLKKYDSTIEILEEFYEVRFKYYKLRKEALIKQLTKEVDILKNKVKFILAVRNDTFDINATNELMLKQLIKDQYTRYPRVKKAKVAGNDDDDVNESESDMEDESKGVVLRDYHYLIGMPINTIGHQLATKCQSEYSIKEKELEVIKNTSIKTTWTKELDHFLIALDEHEEMTKELAAATEARILIEQKKNKIKPPPKVKLPKGIYIKPPIVEFSVPKPKTIVNKKRKDAWLQGIPANKKQKTNSNDSSSSSEEEDSSMD